MVKDSNSKFFIRFLYYTTLVSFLTFPLLGTELDLSQMRDPKTIKEKVNKGYDVNAKRSADGNTVLLAMINMGNDATDKPKLFQILLQAGADPQTKDQWGKSAIEFAERQNNPKVLGLLKHE
ncbi:ankyrin repeat domain-containing protein [Leptospira vanthielii]|uniref:Ankyrin repeat protein n=1 Tax=Leptospira vanthielii serovar Holland str. Waz Holland = ATCC 700522 TaxID=1218591 RepID=N1WBC8_9LEPT|nr:ankyrin repeat domain-containing protein [Leptospira vanthielii]EMY69166.1 ankyrin repeat protein [Leptospira vanthielii serovar Holland str. Waz Holland = ATCC 700522]